MRLLALVSVASVACGGARPRLRPPTAIPHIVVQSQFSGSQVHTLQFSNDGHVLLTAGGPDFAAMLWDTQAARQLRALRGHTSFVSAAALAGDALHAITAADDGTVRLWDGATGSELHRWKVAATAVALDARGRRAAIAAGAMVTLWRLDAYTAERTLAARAEVRALTFDARRDAITAGGAGYVTVWSAATGEVIADCGVGDLVVTRVAFAPDGGVLSIQSDGSAIAWSGCVRVRTWDAAAHTLAISPDGTAVLGAGDDGTRLLVHRAAPRNYLMPLAHETAVFHPDGAIAAGVDSMGVVLFRTKTGETIVRLDSAVTPSGGLAASRDGRHLAVAHNDGWVAVWDLDSGAQIQRFHAHGGIIRGLSFDRDGDGLFTAGEDGTVRHYLWHQGEEITIHRMSFGQPVRSATMSAAGDRLVVQPAYRGALVFDVDQFFNIMGPSLGLAASARYSSPPSPDGTLIATGDGERDAALWNLQSGAVVHVLRGHEEFVRCLAFSPDGKRLVTGSYDATARVWDVASGAEVATLRGHGAPILAVAFAPDGKTIATGAGLMPGQDSTVRLWDAATGAQRAELRGHVSGLTSVAFLAGGGLVASSGMDGLVIIWDARTGAERCRLLTFSNGTWAVVAPNGHFDTQDFERTSGLSWIAPTDPFYALPIEALFSAYQPGLLAHTVAGKVQDAGAPMVASVSQASVEIERVAPNASGRVDVTVAVRGTRAEVSLFRDGRLVGRRRTGGAARVTFANITLPSRGNAIEWSAYAFAGGTKSPTSRRVTPLPPRSAQAKRTAYVLGIGVNAYEQRGLDLAHAADDARAIAELFGSMLKQTGDYDDVVTETLLAERGAAPPQATKAQIAAAFAALARRAGPDDLVAVYFSGHGYADDKGFYLLPYDIGEGRGNAITNATLKRAISDDELARWLEPIDAGDVALILDSCYSASAFDRPGFLPGPLGNRGLAQLAYDKGLWILAASQSDGVSVESAAVQHGLLAHVLVSDAVERASESHAVRDMTWREYLSFAVERVPALYRELGSAATSPKGVHLVPRVASGHDEVQQPVLFDFTARSDRRIVLPGYRANYTGAGDQALREARDAVNDRAAITKLREAVGWFRESGDLEREARAQLELARAVERTGDTTEAAGSMLGAVGAFERAGLPIDALVARVALAAMLRTVAPETALAHASEAALAASEHSYPLLHAFALAVAADLYRARGERALADSLCGAVRTAAQELGPLERLDTSGC